MQGSSREELLREILNNHPTTLEKLIQTYFAAVCEKYEGDKFFAEGVAEELDISVPTVYNRLQKMPAAQRKRYRKNVSKRHTEKSI